MISLILPVYNVEKYIEDCIESILKQTYREFEVVAVDDGSEDESGNILENYKIVFEKSGIHYTVIHQENGGLSAARNSGIEAAVGEYICFVDSDDIIDENYLKSLYDMVVSCKADLVICKYKEFGDSNRIFNMEEWDTGALPIEELLYVISNTVENPYTTSAVVAWNKLIDSRIVKENPFVEGVIHEDEFWIMKVLMSCSSVAWVNEALYLYRIRNSGIMGNNKGGSEVLDAYRQRIDMMSQFSDITFNKYSSKLLTNRFIQSYCTNIANYCYRDLKSNPKEKRFYNKKYKSLMKYTLSQYYRDIRKKNVFKYLVFIFEPQLFYRLFWKKKI